MLRRFPSPCKAGQRPVLRRLPKWQPAMLPHFLSVHLPAFRCSRFNRWTKVHILTLRQLERDGTLPSSPTAIFGHSIRWSGRCDRFDPKTRVNPFKFPTSRDRTGFNRRIYLVRLGGQRPPSRAGLFGEHCSRMSQSKAEKAYEAPTGGYPARFANRDRHRHRTVVPAQSDKTVRELQPQLGDLFRQIALTRNSHAPGR
jgi:hypothetical protein